MKMMFLITILVLLFSPSRSRMARLPAYPQSMSRSLILSNATLLSVQFGIEECPGFIPGTELPLTFTNGSCHVPTDPGEGVVPDQNLRQEGISFVDARGIPNNFNRPSPREVSNRIAAQDDSLGLNIKDASRLLIFFGQFMDHDFALIPEQPEEEMELEEGPVEESPILVASELLTVEIPEDDVMFTEPMRFGRSEFVLDSTFARQFEGIVTPWLDLGTVYGDTQELTDRLRAFEDGLMLVELVNGEEFPPEDELIPGMPLCGDIRCGENTMLLAFHTLFLRNHNYWARRFEEESGETDDDIIFENARIRNIAEYQEIVWEQYLPYLLGRQTFFDLTGRYQGHEPDVDPSVTLAFTTAAFRYGHSGVSNELAFTGPNGETARPSLPLADAFFNQDALREAPSRMAEIFIGQSLIPHDILDSRCVDGIRNMLFTNVMPPGFDLIARNIARGRDHGIGTINEIREAFGLAPFECPNNPRDCFDQLTTDADIAQGLFELYGDISECEAWPCGMAEDSFKDSLLGETFTVILSEQFDRMRRADVIWYENVESILESPTTPAPLELPVTMVDIIERNTGTIVPFENAFMVEPVWLAFATRNEFQVEWFLPPRLRRQIESYTISINGQTTSMPAQDLLRFQQTNVSPGSTVRATVTAELSRGGSETLGSVQFQVPGGDDGLSTGAIVGIALGSTGAVALLAGAFLYARRRPYSKLGRLFNKTDEPGELFL